MNRMVGGYILLFHSILIRVRMVGSAVKLGLLLLRLLLLVSVSFVSVIAASLVTISQDARGFQDATMLQVLMFQSVLLWVMLASAEAVLVWKIMVADFM